MEQFTFEKTKIAGAVIVQPHVFGDERGCFLETYQKDLFEKAGITSVFVQENASYSIKGVLRGMHFQTRHPQAKLIRVSSGRVFDVAVDCRPGSNTFGQWTGVELDARKRNMFYLAKGLAHGILILSETAEFSYLADDYYDPEGEGGIPFDDPDVNVQWPKLDVPFVTSEKDRTRAPFKEQSFEYFRDLSNE